MNLYEETYKLTKQIPRGMVSTYGEIAKALGDIIASRAVGRMLNLNPYKDVPCYRVVYSDGGIGGYAYGVEKKIEMLKKDGIKIVNKKIDLNKYLFKDFKTSYPLKRLREEQEKLKNKLVLEDNFDLRTIAGMDVSYGKYAYGAYIEFDGRKIIKEKVVKAKIEFPYIPTYFAYRELPILQRLIKGEKPSIVMIDGNGLLHPRFFGLASHFGVLNNLPTIGIAKKLLIGDIKKNDVFIRNKKVGRKINKIYVSPGNKISVATAYKITKNYMKYSIPEPIRQAHILANEERRKNEG